MGAEDEITEAARRSREWKSRQAEIEEAAHEDAEIAHRRRAIRERARPENDNANVWRNLIFALLAAAMSLLFFEQQSIEGSAARCFAGAAAPGHYGCAAQISASPWFWMLSRETRELLKANRSNGR